MSFPATRLRRLRKTGVLRGLVRETDLSVANLVSTMFVTMGPERRTPIASLPGVDHLSIDGAVEEAGLVSRLGIPAVLLFGLPAHKDEQGSGAWVPLAPRSTSTGGPRRRSSPTRPSTPPRSTARSARRQTPRRRRATAA